MPRRFGAAPLPRFRTRSATGPRAQNDTRLCLIGTPPAFAFVFLWVLHLFVPSPGVRVASAIARNCDLVQNSHLSPLPEYREREKTRLGVDAAFEVVACVPRDGSMIGTQPGLMTADGRKDGVERVAAGVTHDQAAMTVCQFDVAR